MPVQLPLEGLAALGEYPHLPRNQLVELVTVEALEVAILDEPAIAEADRAQQRAVALDPNRIRKPVVHVRAQLRVVGAEQSNEVLIAHAGEPTAERTNPQGAEPTQRPSAGIVPSTAATITPVPSPVPLAPRPIAMKDSPSAMIRISPCRSAKWPAWTRQPLARNGSAAVASPHARGHPLGVAEILIVDDDVSIRRMLERSLKAEGFGVRMASDGGAALSALERSLPDLLILDVAMPGVDGLGVARRLRSKGGSRHPVLFLTARDTLPDRVAGFEAGGDDYLVKPFAFAELLLRVRGFCAEASRAPDSTLVHRDLSLDPTACRATRSGRTVELTPRETDLLELLLRNVGRTVTRSQALAAVWSDSRATANVVDRYVAYLRRKLGGPPLIETVRGVGFRLAR